MTGTWYTEVQGPCFWWRVLEAGSERSKRKESEGRCGRGGRNQLKQPFHLNFIIHIFVAFYTLLTFLCERSKSGKNFHIIDWTDRKIHTRDTIKEQEHIFELSS